VTDETDRYAWTAGAFESLGDGVFRIPLPMPNDGLRAVNVYAIADGPRVTLIDGGWAEGSAAAKLADSLRTIGYGLADIDRVLVTHIHRDHYTLAIALRNDYGTPVSLGTGERRSIELARELDGDVRPLWDRRLESYGAAAIARELDASQMAMALDRLGLELPDAWLDHGQSIELRSRTLRVLATPGHTVGHVVFADKAHGALFAGDHVLPHITPSVGVAIDGGAGSVTSYLGSLALVRRLPEMRLLPAHGPVQSSVHRRVDELLAHHDRRLAQTLGAISTGGRSVYEVADKLTWTRREQRFRDLDTYNRLLAAHETYAHLEALVARGAAGRTEADGVLIYRAAGVTVKSSALTDRVSCQ
jgi:glyoxylase-like metal-dependent hydrolase (beta-lactamase superfamily II)